MASYRSVAFCALAMAAGLGAIPGSAAGAQDKAPPDQPVTRRISKTPDLGDPNGSSTYSAVAADCHVGGVHIRGHQSDRAECRRRE